MRKLRLLLVLVLCFQCFTITTSAKDDVDYIKNLMVGDINEDTVNLDFLIENEENIATISVKTWDVNHEDESIFEEPLQVNNEKMQYIVDSANFSKYKGDFKSSIIITTKESEVKTYNTDEFNFKVKDTFINDAVNESQTVPEQKAIVNNIRNNALSIGNVQVMNNGSSYTITADIAGADIDCVKFPTWTSKNGQDDVTWEKGTINGSKVSYTVNMRDHKYEAGEYQTHIYIYDKAGQSTGMAITNQSLKLVKPTLSNVQVKNSGSSYTISADIAGVDIDCVKFPTWTSKNGQDDVTWEKGTINGSKVSYTVNMKDHKYEAGEYQTHIYIYDKAGQSTGVVLANQTLKLARPTLSNVQVKNSGSSYTITADIAGVDIDCVKFPTWTSKNGQDDVTWEKGTINGSKVSYTVNMRDHKYEAGEYQTHIYIYDKAGQSTGVVLANQTLKLARPTLNNVQVKNSGSSYTITADIAGVDIDCVKFPTWTSKNGQDDVTWEKGTINGSKVSYTVNMNDHNYEIGEYQTHIYIYDKAGQSTGIPISKQIMKVNTPTIENVKIVNAGSSYTVTADIKGENIDSVQFPTWTTKNGQDDIVWGKGSISGNKVSYTVNAKDHRYEEGKYETHIYVYDKSGQSTGVVVEEQSIKLNSPIISNIKVTNSEGKYIIECNVTSENIKSVEFPTWTTKNGQDDIFAGSGTINGNTVRYEVDFKDHNFETGEYQTHIYAKDQNGKITGAVVPLQVISNKAPIITNIKVSDVSSQGYLVTCTVEDDYGIDKVLFPTWSNTNGQDDMVWGQGEVVGNTVSYRVYVKDHKFDFGEYTSHIYAYDKGGNMSGAIAPAVSINAVSSTGWDIINGHKYLYDAAGNIVGSGTLIIDISEHNGVIDWNAVKNAGVDGVILRSSYGYADDFSEMDKRFAYNVSELNRLGIPYGIYHFSYAKSAEDGRLEAEYTLRCMREAGARPSLPIFYDLESSTYVGGRDAAFYTAITREYTNVIKNAGYTTGVYANYNWWSNLLTDSSFNQHVKWVAHYGTNANNLAGTANPNWHPNSEFKIWQYSSCGSVNGILSRVDMNIMFNW